jgi:HAMP domain-containing protein
VINSPEERALYNDWVKQWTEYETGIQEVVALSRSSVGNYPTEAQQLNEGWYLAIGQKADVILNKDIELNNKSADAAGAAADKQYATAFMLLAIIIAAAGLVGVTVGFYLVRDVSRGIDSIVSPMLSLGQGDLAAEVPHRGEATEMGKMADALQLFKGSADRQESCRRGRRPRRRGENRAWTTGRQHHPRVRNDDRRDRADRVVGIDRTGSVGGYADRDRGAGAGTDHDGRRRFGRGLDQRAVGGVRH